MFKIQNIRYIFVLALLVLTAMTYHPMFSNVVTFEGGVNPLNRYVVLLAIITFLLHFNYHSWFKNRLIRTYVINLVIVGILGYLLVQMDVTKQYEIVARDLLMAFIFLTIGYNSKLSYRQLVVLSILYSFCVAFVTYRQLVQHAGGFVITDQYISYGKNTLGVMCAVSCVMLLVLFFDEKNKYLKLMMLILYIYISILCISIRARTDFLAILLLTVFCIYKHMYRKKITMNSLSWIIFGSLSVICVLIIFPHIFHSISDYIIDSFTRNREGDIASGRDVGWHRALSVISESPLFGNMELRRQYDPLGIHNYFLRQLSSFGFLGSIPVLILYLYLFFYIIKRIVVLPIKDSYLGFYLFTILLIVSLGEPTFPYAPGSGVVVPFILLGSTLYQEDNPQMAFCK